MDGDPYIHKDHPALPAAQHTALTPHQVPNQGPDPTLATWEHPRPDHRSRISSTSTAPQHHRWQVLPPSAGTAPKPPQRASACTVRVLSGTSAPALSYAGRRASYTLQQATEGGGAVEGRRVVPGCPAPACGGALCTCMAHCHVCAYMVHS
jgi:hypothetical protein